MKQSYGIYIIIFVVAVFSVAFAWYSSPRAIIYNESFEQNFGGWMKNVDVPLDPNNPGHSVAWNVTRSVSKSYSGEYSVEMYIDGRQDDGTVWVEKKLSARSNSRIHVEVSLEFYSEDESFNVIAGVCMYAGISSPKAEGDFTLVGNANELAGWKHYTYKTTLLTDSSGEIWVATGITVLWETEMTYYIDDIAVTIS